MALFIDKLIHNLLEHDSGPTPLVNDKTPVKINYYHLKKADDQKKHHHSSSSKSRCAKIKVDQVVANRIVCCRLDLGPCDIGFAVPPCSILTGTIDVTILECEAKICGPHQPVILKFLLFIQEEFTLTLPDGTKYPLEFGFHRRCTRCIPPIDTKCLDAKRIRCEVDNLQKIKSKVRFTCADSLFDCHATIAVHLGVVVAVSLVVEEQLCVALCRAPKHDEKHMGPAQIWVEEEQDDCDEDEK